MAEQEYSPSASAPTKATSPRYAGAGTATTSPEEELKKLQEELLKFQRDAEKLKKQIEDDQARIKTIQKSVGDSNQLTTAVGAAVQNVASDRFEIQDFLANEMQQIVNHEEVKNHQAEIDAKMAQVKDAIKQKRTETEQLEQRLKDERTAAQTATDDSTKKKQALDELKDQPRKIQDSIGKLRKLRQRIDSEGANKPLVKYVLATELKDQWEPAKKLLMSNEEVEALYYSRSDDLRHATDAAAAADAKYKKTQGELEAARKELEARESSRLDDMIKRVSEIGSREPATAGTSARAGAAAKA